MAEEEITIDTASYEREHGHKPRGRDYWRFVLCTSRVTEKDHVFDSKTAMSYDKALQEAKALAVRRRANCIRVLP